MKRDKEATRKKILAAVERIITKRGFDGLGINAIAREAGVDKVLVYRYFGDRDQLLRAFAVERADIFMPPPLAWPRRDKGAPISVTEIASAVLRDQLEELRRRPPTQEVIRQELLETNTLTEALAAAREKTGKEFLARLPFDQEKHPDCDLGAVFALLHAGITYLVVGSRKIDFYQGIDLKSARGWGRLEQAIAALLEAYFMQHAIEPPRSEHAR